MNTIIDVAKLAGVSKSTVSRVISGNGNIRPETRRKVEAAMSELHFVPNQLARGIRTGHTHTIALMVSETANLYYNELLYHIEAIAREHDYMVMLCNSGTDSVLGEKYISWLQQRNVDGLLYCFYRDNEVTDRLYQLSSSLPIVFLDNPLLNRSNISCVGADGLIDVAEVIRDLHQHGAKSIAFIGIDDICNNTYRCMGYRAGLASCGYDFDPKLCYTIPFDKAIVKSHFQVGFEAARELMSLQNRPDAIVAATDMLAIGALKYFSYAGISVPQQVSVVGYDNIHLSSMVFPALSTIAQPVDRIANEAMDILLHKIEVDNSYNKSFLAKSTFLKRASTLGAYAGPPEAF